MATRQRTRIENFSAKTRQVVKRNPALVPALIAASAAIFVAGFNYLVTERVRTELSEQTVNLARQASKLEELKVEVAKAAHATEEIRLTVDFSKLANDLVPNMAFSCTTTTTSPRSMTVFCNFKNTGTVRLRFHLDEIHAFDRETGVEIPNYMAQWTKRADWTAPAGISSQDTYVLNFSSVAATKPDAKITLIFVAKTHPAQVAMTKRLAKGLFTDAELEQFSTQYYQWGINQQTNVAN